MRDKILQHFQGNFRTFYSKYLQNPKQIGGDEYQSLCPFPSHNDTNPSFNFNNQTGLYQCHGCGKKGDIFHFYGKINSKGTKKDFRAILKGIADDFSIPWEEQQKRIVKTYDYTDASGNLLFQVCRMDPKDFRQRHRNGNDKWIWNLKGVERVLYRLPEVLKAQEILVVEGEKDADTIASLALAGTTSPMGARKWRDEYSGALKGKDVVLVPDNDNEGREHMTRVGASLQGLAKSLKWVDLPDLPSKGDISDWVGKFSNREDAKERLAIMIENADPYTPPKKTSLEDVIMSVQEFHALDLPAREIYLYPWLKADSINLVSGWRGVGKTWFSWGIADAITKGQPFGPWECEKPVPVLILDGEMPITDLQERVEALGLNSDRPCPLHIYSDALANQNGLSRAYLANESWREKMKSILLARHIKLWIVDNLASLAGGLDENSKRDWDPINTWLLELRFAGIATMMLHHVNKEGGQRGTSAREDNLDVSVILKNPHDYIPEDGARFIAHFSKSRVSHKNLQLLTDTEFKLVQEDSGAYVWVTGGVRRQTKAEVIRLLDEGTKAHEIADILGISKGRVSQLKKEAVDDGFTSEKTLKMTQEGFSFVHGGGDEMENFSSV